MYKQEKFFFCYSSHMSYFLVQVKGLTYVTQARRMSDNREFFLFERNDQLSRAIEEYMQDIRFKISFEELERMRKKN